MKITSDVFEAYLKCPTKCWLRATDEPSAGLTATCISSWTLQLFTLCLQAMTTPARSGLTNGVFARLASRDTKRRPLFMNTILATAGRMK